MATEKRFTYVRCVGFRDNWEYLTPYQIVDLLNELYEENQRLRKQNDELINGIKETTKTCADAIVAGMEEEIVDYEFF